MDVMNVFNVFNVFFIFPRFYFKNSCQMQSMNMQKSNEKYSYRGFLPHDSLESRVSCEQISCRWVRFPSNEGIKKGTPLRNPYFTSTLARLAWERLQIDTDLLRIIISTADELSGGTNIDDLERPWTPKIGF